MVHHTTIQKDFFSITYIEICTTIHIIMERDGTLDHIIIQDQLVTINHCQEISIDIDQFITIESIGIIAMEEVPLLIDGIHDQILISHTEALLEVVILEADDNFF